MRSFACALNRAEQLECLQVGKLRDEKKALQSDIADLLAVRGDALTLFKTSLTMLSDRSSKPSTVEGWAADCSASAHPC